MIRFFFALILILGSARHSLTQDAIQDQRWTVYTDTYRPFIAAPDEPQSDLTANVKLVLDHAELDYDLSYASYSYADYAVRSERNAVSFPWRKSADREAVFNLSRPLATFTTRVFYNRRFWPEAAKIGEAVNAKIGLVANTVYGETICTFLSKAAGPLTPSQAHDKSAPLTRPACPFLDGISLTRETGLIREYPSESAALKALLLNEIDFLALPLSVKAATMQSVFPDQAELVQPVPGIDDQSTFHIIAPKTSAGEAFIAAFDRSYSELIDAGVLSPWTFTQALNPEIAPPARLVAAEGFPMIIAYACTEELDDGQSCPKGKREFYALPQGSRVLVLSWSQSIQQPFRNDEKLYEIMTDETKILTLDDPSIGRELYVKTMHISLSR